MASNPPDRSYDPARQPAPDLDAWAARVARNASLPSYDTDDEDQDLRGRTPTTRKDYA
jgi:hypothetical protein